MWRARAGFARFRKCLFFREIIRSRLIRRRCSGAIFRMSLKTAENAANKSRVASEVIFLCGL